jgi:two-component system cell cycle sensor histidine kinase/response regulator CckA
MKARLFRASIASTAVGVAIYITSFLVLQRQNNYWGDLLGVVGTAIMVGSAFAIVSLMTRNVFARFFFGCGAVLLVLAGAIDFTEEVKALEGVFVLGRSGRMQDAVMQLFFTMGYVCILATFIAVLYELAALKNEAEEEQRRFQRLYEATLYLSRVADMAADAVIGCDKDGNVRSWNKGAKQLFGYGPDEAVGMPLQKLVVPRLADIGPDLFGSVIDERRPRYIEVTGKKKDGTQFLVAATLATVLDDHGQAAGIGVVARDIDEQKRRERELVASRSLIAAALHNANVGMFIVNREGEFIEFNARMMTLTGWTEDEPPTLDKMSTDIIDSSAQLSELVRNTVIGKGQPVEFHNLAVYLPGERRRICTMAITPVQDEHDTFVAAVGIALDVTDREALQSRLLESQKMESIGRLAGGIAHDFNNLLGGILGYASLMTQKVEPASPLAKYARAIEESAVRGSELTHQLLAFARGGTLVRQSVSLNDIIRRTVRLLARSLPPNIELEVDGTEDIAAVDGDASQLQQLLMNLCLNSRDAISGAGTIRIRTKEIIADNPLMLRLDLPKVGRYVQLIVEDNGCGMSPEVVRRVFEPFFSTKEQGKGYGLGMSVVYGIVQSHHGRVHVTSELNKFTHIDIYFPASASSPVRQVENFEKPRRIKGGTETLLVVDDEKLIRALLHDILEYQGYTLIEAENGDEAIRKYQEKSPDIALVLLDLIMPGRDGVETLRELQTINPDVRCIISSGYGTDKLNEAILNNPNVRLVPKPYLSSTLVSNIRELIDAN